MAGMRRVNHDALATEMARGVPIHIYILPTLWLRFRRGTGREVEGQAGVTLVGMLRKEERYPEG